MNAKLKKKWIEKLQSGKYKQGKHYLRTSASGGDRFCCLGVLCDIVDSSAWKQKGDWISWGRNVSTPPSEVIDPYIAGGLSRMNDQGWSFSQIADEIQRLVPEDPA